MGTPDREYAIGHVDSHDAAVPDVAAEYAVEGREYLVDGRAHGGAAEDERESASETSDTGHYRRAHGDFTAKPTDTAALYASGRDLQLVEQSLGDKRHLRTGIEPKMQRHSIGTRHSDYWEPDPEHVPVVLGSRGGRITQPDHALAVIQLDIQLTNYVEADDAVDLHLLGHHYRLRFPHLHHRFVHDHRRRVIHLQRSELQLRYEYGLRLHSAGACHDLKRVGYQRLNVQIPCDVGRQHRQARSGIQPEVVVLAGDFHRDERGPDTRHRHIHARLRRSEREFLGRNFAERIRPQLNARAIVELRLEGRLFFQPGQSFPLFLLLQRRRVNDARAGTNDRVARV